jgi:hypothetical protein
MDGLTGLLLTLLQYLLGQSMCRQGGDGRRIGLEWGGILSESNN